MHQNRVTRLEPVTQNNNTIMAITFAIQVQHYLKKKPTALDLYFVGYVLLALLTYYMYELVSIYRNHIGSDMC